MTADLASGRDFPELSGAGQRLPKVRTQGVRHGRLFGIRTGQVVSTQAAAVALLIVFVSVLPVVWEFIKARRAR